MATSQPFEQSTPAEASGGRNGVWILVVRMWMVLPPLDKTNARSIFESVRVCERFRAGAILLLLVGTGRRPDEAVRHIRTIGKHVFQLSSVAMAVKGLCCDQIEPYRSPIA